MTGKGKVAMTEKEKLATTKRKRLYVKYNFLVLKIFNLFKGFIH
jgi:hypothetical protein